MCSPHQGEWVEMGFLKVALIKISASLSGFRSCILMDCMRQMELLDSQPHQHSYSSNALKLELSTCIQTPLASVRPGTNPFKYSQSPLHSSRRQIVWFFFSAQIGVMLVQRSNFYSLKETFIKSSFICLKPFLWHLVDQYLSRPESVLFIQHQILTEAGRTFS